MRDEMDKREAIEMMNRCKNEIVTQRAIIERLKAKADAYDSLCAVLRLLPQPSVTMGEDLVSARSEFSKALIGAMLARPEPQTADEEMLAEMQAQLWAAGLDMEESEHRQSTTLMSR